MVLLSLFRKDKNGSHSGSRFLGSLSNMGVTLKSSITNGCIFLMRAEISGGRLFSDFFSRHAIGNGQEDDGADEIP